MSSRRKNPVFKLIGIVLGVSGGFFLANVAGGILNKRATMNKIKEHENENNLMHSIIFGMQTIGINADTQNAYFNCQCSSMTIEMKDIPVNDDVYINISSIFSRVTVKLPVGVKVVHEGRGMFGSVRSIPTVVDDDIPTVHIIRNNTIATRTIVNVVASETEVEDEFEE